MAKSYKIKGGAEVMRNLRNEIKRIDNVTLAGLIEASIVFHRGTETNPRTPVDWGNLYASWFTTAGHQPAESGKFLGPKAGEMTTHHTEFIAAQKSEADSKKIPFIIFGFSANYAAYVHENYGATNWKRPGSGAGFLITSLDENMDEAIKQIRAKAQIK